MIHRDRTCHNEGKMFFTRVLFRRSFCIIDHRALMFFFFWEKGRRPPRKWWFKEKMIRKNRPFGRGVLKNVLSKFFTKMHCPRGPPPTTPPRRRSFFVIRKRCVLIRRESTTRRTHLDCILLMVCAELGGNLGPPVVIASISCMTRAFERGSVAAEPPIVAHLLNFFSKPPDREKMEKQSSSSFISHARWMRGARDASNSPSLIERKKVARCVCVCVLC